MTKYRKVALGIVIVAPLVAGGFIAQERATQDGGRLLGQVLDLVQSRYVDSVDEAALYEKAARGLVNQLQDPYSELLTPRQVTQFNTTTGGRYGGLGMSIENQPGKGPAFGKATSSLASTRSPHEVGITRESPIPSVARPGRWLR
jgi:C-terminal processing protease CtpA/Prc